MAATEQPPVISPPEPTLTTNGRWIAYIRLLQMRMLEMWREPEVIFWVFVFPLLLALGLGIAFRGKPPDVTMIAIVDGPGAQQVVSLVDRSGQHASIHADVVSAPVARDGFRLGKYALVVSMDDAGIIALTRRVPRACWRAPRLTMRCKRRMAVRIPSLQPTRWRASRGRATSTS